MSMNINVHDKLATLHCNRNVLCDPVKAKADEIKRRKILRLAQVRQQSNAFAAEKRRNVQEENKRQLARIEQIKNDELRAWKEKYIGETQHQLDNCLLKVGEAHAAALKENELERKAQEQRIKNHRLATKRGKEALAILRQNTTDAKRKIVPAASVKKATNATIATQVTDSLDRIFHSNQQKATEGQERLPNRHVYANVLEEDNIVDLSSSSDTQFFLEPQEKPHASDPYVDLAKSETEIVNISSESLSSSLEIIAKGSRLSKTLPLACSKTSRPTGNAVNSKKNSAHYSPSKYVAADTSSETALPSNGPTVTQTEPNTLPLTQVSDLINRRKISKVTLQVDNDFNNKPTGILPENITPPPIIVQGAERPSRSCLRPSSSNILHKPLALLAKPKVAPSTNAKHSTVTRNFLKKTNSPAPRKHTQPIKTHLKTKTKSVNPIPTNKEYIPLFVKPTTSSRLFVEGHAINPPQIQSNVWPKPTSSATITEPEPSEEKVTFYDHANRFAKEYDPPENVMHKELKDDAQPNAMTAALEEMQLDAERNERNEQLKRLTKLRCQQTLEKERIRKDYDKMNAQLDELSKKENFVKIHDFPNSNLSDQNLQQLSNERQQNMNKMVEDYIHKPVLITCPRVINREQSSLSDLNVASNTGAVPKQRPISVLNSSDESCTSILLGYVDSRSRTLIDDIGQHQHQGNKMNELLHLLDQLNMQKKLLLEEIEKTKDAVPSSNLAKIYKTVRNIDKEKSDILTHNDGDKENKPEDRQTLGAREQQEQLKEQRLEAKIRELIVDEQKKALAAKQVRKNVKIQTERQPTEHYKKNEINDDSLDSTGAPVKIIINVTGNNKLEKMLLEPRKQTSIPVSDEPGQVFQKTPAKKAVNPKHVETEPKITLNVDADGSSTSTAYRSLPTTLNLATDKKQTKSTRAASVTTPALGHYITRLLGMSRASIEQLGVSSCTSLETPSSSIINVSANMSSENGIIDEERVQKVKRFINESYSFLSDVEDSLKQTNVNDDANKTVEAVWMKMLKNKEAEMKRMKKESRHLKEKLRKKEEVERAREAITAPPLIRPILKKPNSPKKVQVFVEEKTTPISSDESLVNHFEDITGDINKKISNLDEMINQVRREKKKILESTLTSNATTTTTNSERGQNSTEYLEISNKRPEDTSSEVSDLRTQEGTLSEELGQKLISSRQIGISRDSGICVSRPMTATDVRDRISPVDTSEGNDIIDLTRDCDGTDKLLSPKKATQKPPPALKRYSPTLEQEKLHELSTIVEVDTPATSRINTSINNQHVQRPSQIQSPGNANPFELSADTRDALKIQKYPPASKLDADVLANSSLGGSLDQLIQIEKFPNHKEYANGTSGLCDTASLDAADQLKETTETNTSDGNHSLAFRQFPTRKEFIAGVSGLCDTASIAELQDTESKQDDISFPDVEAELKKRNLIDRSFESLHFESSEDEELPQKVSSVAAAPKQRPLTMHSSSSSDQLEHDMKAMGLPWASAMLKKNKERQTLSSTTSSSSGGIRVKTSARSLSAKHVDSFVDSKLMEPSTATDNKNDSLSLESTVKRGKPMSLKEFLMQELQKKSQSMSSSISLSDESSSVASQFMQSMQQVSERQTTRRTSTPVRQNSTDDSQPTAATSGNYFFSGESALSSVRESSANSTNGKVTSGNSTSGKETSGDSSFAKRQQAYQRVLEQLAVPDLKLNLPSTSNSSTNS